MPSILNSDDGVVSGTSGIKTTGGNDGVLNIQTNGTNAISISSGQRSTFPTTIGVGGATPSTSGSGISFPATQSASSDANTLEDFEEGTWTPVVPASSVTYTSRIGTYTKIGNVVYINCFVQIASITSPTGGGGAAFITGLPFTSVSAATAYYPQFVTSWGGSNFGGTVGIAQVLPSSTALSALGSTNNSAFVDSVPADIWDAANNFVKLSGFYYTST
jgi:hypothetical protein